MIPVNAPWLQEEDLASLVDCFKSGWISSAGPYIEKFESAWANYCGVRHGIAVSNGTTALQVATEAIGVGPGDEVIMPSFTIISCAAAVVRAGGVPVLVDCDPVTWCMNPAQVEAKITSRTKAIMVVHMYGHPVDMDAIMTVAREHGLLVIEDAAEVHGAEYLSERLGNLPRWRRCGSMGDIATFSFFANKLITTGEGGMVITNDDELARRSRSLRNLCFQPPRRFLHEEQGYQFRLTNMQAAVGLRQVSRMDQILERKRWAAHEYTKRLARHTSFQLPTQMEWARSVYWVYGIVLSEELPFDAAEMIRRLDNYEIETRPFFMGMHEQPVYRRLGLFQNEAYPVTERIARRGFYLPSGLALTIEQIESVCAAVDEIMEVF